MRVASDVRSDVNSQDRQIYGDGRSNTKAMADTFFSMECVLYMDLNRI